jgi:hypothetical protein
VTVPIGVQRSCVRGLSKNRCLFESGPTDRQGRPLLQRALVALSEKNILREEEHEGGMRMCFEGPFFAQWVRAFPCRVAGFIIAR